LDSGVWLAAQDRRDPFHEPAAALLARSSNAAALDLTLYEVATSRWCPGALRRPLAIFST
jgi:hypothetical protein